MPLFTADNARSYKADDQRLDQLIELAVKTAIDSGESSASIRIYPQDPWAKTIKQELERRGFQTFAKPLQVSVEDYYFEW